MAIDSTSTILNYSLYAGVSSDFTGFRFPSAFISPAHASGPSLEMYYILLAMKRWLTIIFLSILSLLFIYPSAFIYPKDTLPDTNDTRLIAYIIGQVQNNILEHKPLHFGTFFAPDKNTLAYSDLFLTSAIVTLPARFFTDHPIVIFNLTLTLNFILTIISSYLLFSYFFKDHWITTLTVILFNFSGFHLSYLPHLQIFSLWPLCLSVYFATRYLQENRSIYLPLFFLTVTAQIAESIFPVYLIFFTCTILAIGHMSKRYLKNVTGVAEVLVKKFTIYSLLFIPLWIFLLLPYYQLHTSLPEATRPIRDAAHFSLGLDQIFTFYHSGTIILIFFTSLFISKILGSAGELVKKQNAAEVPEKSRAERIRTGNPGTEVEHSFLRSSKRFVFDIWWIVFFFSFIMSLGPVLKIFGQNLRIFGFPIPLPYTLFYYLFPGFTGFRTPSRFIVLALLSAVVIIGFQLKPFFGKLKTKTKLILILLVLSLLFVEADLPLKSYPVNINMHPVYQEVTRLPIDAVILELPIKLWNMPDHEIESVRSLYTLFHKHRRFGGFSGFATNRWIQMVQEINAYGLTLQIVEALSSFGVTHIIQNNTLSDLKSDI